MMRLMTTVGVALAASGGVSATHPDLEFISFGDVKQNPGDMTLHMMPDELANGAMCLDGTPTGFYYAPASDPKHANDWQIYFQGGGWCYDEMDCLGRSKGNLGSSTKWAQTSSMGGIMSSDPTSNPDFAGFNRVHMPYCDGNSFSGDRTEAVVVNGTKLWFRGRRNIDATFRALYKLGLDKAENVLLTGCSAGGLATYLHTDYVATLLPKTVTKYKSAPISGFFLLHDTVENKPVYPTEMKNIFHLANSTNGVNAGCIAATPLEDQWMCNFAEHSYAHTQSPIFPLNSALDSWQTGCIYTSELPVAFPNQTGFENGNCSAAPGWHDCAGDPEKCTSDQIETMNQYEKDFQTHMATLGPTYTKAGNGAFIHSCHTHCEAQSSAWNTFQVNGKTIQQAVSAWWNGPDDAPAAGNTYKPCLYKSSSPHKCNPTC
eukprot:m.178703 g.178703  ORF g.178703 m.178703 type:complete len:431 (+) comp14602_c0_seq1:70-1362(+)